ncbi:MAG: hypothetical protein EXR48_02635 [Dehalococcoidia bacterium]|nr:hypothetical protein [Dehalococcoidia bacterium]
MSRLFQALERLHRGATIPLGFGLGRAARPERAPAMLLVASFGKADRSQEAAKLADLLLFKPSGQVTQTAVKKLAEAAGELPWGIQVDTLTKEQSSLLEKQGCDFVIFNSLAVPLDALKLDDVSYLLSVPKEFSEEQARALEATPIDGVVSQEAVAPPFTLDRLMELAGLRGLFGKPFFLPISGVPSAWELECLRDAGVDGLVASADQVGPEALAELHKALREVPSRRPGKGERFTALLPQVVSASERQPAQLPDEDDDE